MHGPSGNYLVIGFAAGSVAGEPLGFDCIAVNANRTGNHFSIRNTTIRNHRACGMLIKASHGAIDNNLIEGSTMGGIIIPPELYWAEADYSRDLRVTNNVIRNVGKSIQAYGGLAIGAVDPNDKLNLQLKVLLGVAMRTFTKATRLKIRRTTMRGFHQARHRATRPGGDSLNVFL